MIAPLDIGQKENHDHHRVGQNKQRSVPMEQTGKDRGRGIPDAAGERDPD
jgi:hypothetical protein